MHLKCTRYTPYSEPWVLAADCGHLTLILDRNGLPGSEGTFSWERCSPAAPQTTTPPPSRPSVLPGSPGPSKQQLTSLRGSVSDNFWRGLVGIEPLLCVVIKTNYALHAWDDADSKMSSLGSCKLTNVNSCLLCIKANRKCTGIWIEPAP